MTDAVAATRPGAIDPAAEATRARIRKRYRAEARFRLYGIGAILFAAVALVVLVGDIVSKALPAFTMAELVLSVNVTQEEIDPAGSRDPVVLAQGDYLKMIRASLATEFPAAIADRKQRQKLYGLLSSDAAFDLRSRVMADPALIGTTVSVPVLLSDDADLFYKGYMTPVERSAGVGTLTPSATEGEVTLLSTANDFSDDLVAVKRELAETARRLRTERERLKGLAADTVTATAETQAALTAARAANSGDIATLEGNLAKQQSDAESLKASIAGLDAQIADLEGRFDASGAPEALGTDVPSLLVEVNGGVVRATTLANDRITGTVLIPLASTDSAAAGQWQQVRLDRPEALRKLSDQEVAWLERLQERGYVAEKFNWLFFTSGDSREAELAGILGALVGSAYTMLVTLVICLPLGVGAAIYLEEFAPKSRFTQIIEVNINNLAAVPSIVFGLLGLAVFLNFFGLPRSSPLVGGLVLALLVLPTIIIASRAALRAVPPSIREGALGIGASHQQAVFHHVLPLAMPGVLTGTIIGMAHALGETAPLLLIGMIAFIVDVPTGVTQAATVLPVQIFLWSDLPEVGFQAKTSGAIIVLLLFLFLMNGIAIVLRKRFERRW